jgi:Zn-dependent protease
MLLGEPAPSQADVHFRLFGIPVRVHPYFWLVSLVLGAGGIGGKSDPVDTLVWVVVIFVSILVHELGHAFMQRVYGGNPWITLYSLGGLASCNDCDRSPRRQIIISLAGPVAGFLLAAAILLTMRLTGHVVGITLSSKLSDFESIEMARVIPEQMGPFVVYFERAQSYLLNLVIWDALWVNIMWGLVNLLPVYPLDGGQIARELFTLRYPREGIIQSLQLSAGVAVLVAIYGVLRGSLLVGVMFGMLAYESFQALQAYRQHWR